MVLQTNFFSLISKHISLLILGIASVAFFLTNIILKDYLSSEDYGLYSLFITYISLISSFGLLGFEQVIIRHSKILNNKVTISTYLILPIIFSAIFVSILASNIFLINYSISVTYFWLVVFTFLVIFAKLIFNLFRLLSYFVSSQIALNLWKLCLFSSILVLFLNSEVINLDNIYNIIFISLLVTFSMIFLLYRSISFSRNIKIKKLFSQAALFLLSLTTISLIGYGDRFFIESRFGLETLGNYFFFLTLYLFPFSLLQAYVGFKEIVGFKLSYSHTLLLEKLKKLVFYSVTFGACLLFFSFLIDYFGYYSINFSENLYLILLLICLGVIKMNYALLSSAFGAVCDNKMLFKSNLYSILSIFLLIPLIYYYSLTINITIMFLIVLWFIRCVIWYKQLLNFES